VNTQKTGMCKRTFRIGDLSKNLKVKKYIIRFWEKEFNIKSYRSEGGQRFYTQEDLNLFRKIKDLLYNKRFTILGAKNELSSPPPPPANIFAAKKNIIGARSEKKVSAEDVAAPSADTLKNKKIFVQTIKKLKQELLNLKKLLEQ
jgi:DNA-binding transcriptional MerR regulator